MPKAVELYKNGRENKILLSGGTTIETPYGMMTEAEVMKKKAMD